MTYTGPDSGAFPGRCTETPGYISDFEIGKILRTNPTAQELWDPDSYSDIVVFNDTQWVAYMKRDNKKTRESLYPTLNFLGTADWAVDLQSDSGGGGNNGNSSSGGTYYVDPEIWDAENPVVTARLVHLSSGLPCRLHPLPRSPSSPGPPASHTLV